MAVSDKNDKKDREMWLARTLHARARGSRKTEMESFKSLFSVVVLFIFVVSGCRSIPAPQEVVPFDTWTRPADGMVMVYVPGGEFQMGSDEDDIEYALQMCGAYGHHCERGWFEDELPAHTVTLDNFWMDRTEVTNGQYQRCVEEDACNSPIMDVTYTRAAYFSDETYSDYPVIHVTWNQAVAYCEWAEARLPTEAEWEYAARGPQGNLFPWGNDFAGTYLNYCDANCDIACADQEYDDGFRDTAPAANYPAGASWCGALNMAGNVWEYTADWYDEQYYDDSPVLNPEGPLSWTRGRVVRGGAWGSCRVYTRSTFRLRDDPRQVIAPVGFRCVRSSE
jgi:formylglycine-generating enzyme required for sulfatase activity